MKTSYWQFLKNDGTFIWNNPGPLHYLYFPLCNESGFMSSITPRLHGDVKTGQNSFLTPPVSINDINNAKSARNFWVYIDGYGPVSVSGNSKREQMDDMAHPEGPILTVEGGLLYHKLTRVHKDTALQFEVLSFVPVDHNLELMMVTIENCGESTLSITPTSAIPIYGRSAENLRDHRHVTSLVNRTTISDRGIEVRPEILFDERGHRYNSTIYFVHAAEEDGTLPEETLGDLKMFIGNQGDLEWPEFVVQNKSIPEDQDPDGKETIAASRFKKLELAPGQRRRYIIMMGIETSLEQIHTSYMSLNTYPKVMSSFQKTKVFWQEQATKVTFDSGLKDFGNWMKWVEIQPILRKIYGNSFLPHHDYGKGGRGWRDLWQDLLSIILLRPEESREHLINNFGGIRLDGTNATIIGTATGEFIADRNNISRVWMDHGTWPFMTTMLYIHQSGDLNIIFEKNSYFRDPQIKRANEKDSVWSEAYGNRQQGTNGEIYEGTLLEHILVEHYTSFHNVGVHNIILLEGADWNDTLDMAREHGESVPFTALYGSNMIKLATLLEKIKTENGLEQVDIFSELSLLIQSGNYDDPSEKQTRLNDYFDAIYPHFSGEKTSISLDVLIHDLIEKGNWILEHVRSSEYVEKDNEGFFNGYYNNENTRVDGFFDDSVRMNLTGQVFPIMSNAASIEQVHKVHASVKKHLQDKTTGGYRLNSNLGPNKLNFGRGFAFKYGEKENGAIFSHMVVMYMNALYQRGLVSEAHEVFTSIYDLATNPGNEIYPGIPEYFNLDGQGLYHYLTGSASWLFLTVVTEMYGVKGDYGNLALEPKLMPEQFKNSSASITTTFGGQPMEITFLNPEHKSPGEYDISSVTINGKECAPECIIKNNRVLFERKYLQSLQHDGLLKIQVKI